MLYVLIVLAILTLVVVFTLLYLSTAEWVIVRYDMWITRRLAQRGATDREEPDQNISMW